MPANFKIIDNKKYMWDAKTYANEGDTLNIAAAYKKNGFDVQLINEEGKHLIYTRRLAVLTTDKK